MLFGAAGLAVLVVAFSGAVMGHGLHLGDGAPPPALHVTTPPAPADLAAPAPTDLPTLAPEKHGHGGRGGHAVPTPTPGGLGGGD